MRLDGRLCAGASPSGTWVDREPAALLATGCGGGAILPRHTGRALPIPVSSFNLAVFGEVGQVNHYDYL